MIDPVAAAAPVRVLVVDDEPIARAGLKQMLAEHPWLKVCGEAAHGEAALAQIAALRPELVFLDIQMPGLDGLQVFAQLSHRPCVVYTTAWSQHAVTAFELGAVDYLLKPFGPERLERTLERVRAVLGEPATATAPSRLAECLGTGPIQRLFARQGRCIVPIEVSAVHWFEAVGDYVAVHLGIGLTPPLLHVALARLEQRLDPAAFQRLHRTHIVNLAQVRAFRRLGGEQLIAELRDGTRLRVSRARATELRELAR